MSSSIVSSDPSTYNDYRDPSVLEDVFQREGTITGTADYFDIAPATCRKWLLRYEIYEPDSQGLETPAQQLSRLGPEDIGLKAIGER